MSNKNILVRTVSLALLMLLMAAPLAGQIVTDSEAKASVHGMKVASIFRTPERAGDGEYDKENPGYQELLVQYFLTISGSARQLGLVIPVPSNASAISIRRDTDMNAVADYHTETLMLARDQWSSRTQWISGTEPEQAPLLDVNPAGDFKSVGEIQYEAVNTSGVEALKAIRGFFAGAGLAAPSEEPLRWHLKNDWCFVCIAFSSAKGADSMAGQVALPPIRIGFASFKAYLPTTYIVEGDDVEFEIALVSDNALRSGGIEKARQLFGDKAEVRMLKNMWRRKDLSESLTDIFTDKATTDKHDRWIVNVVRGKGYYPTNDHIDAFGIKGGIVTDEIPGFWYFGDDEPGIFEGFFRQHGLAVMLSMAGLFLFLLVGKLIKDARKAKA